LPLIHNIANTDLVVGVHSETTDAMTILLTTEAGHAYLRDRRGVPADVVDKLPLLGYSAIANIIGAIKAARYYGWGKDDVIVTVATDSSKLYESEFEHIKRRAFGGDFDAVSAGETFGRTILGASTSDVLEIGEIERRRVFNLGYFTWVEQQNITVEEFRQRRSEDFWREVRAQLPAWDALINDFNSRAGVSYA
jgi:hypothetical protein